MLKGETLVAFNMRLPYISIHQVQVALLDAIHGETNIVRNAALRGTGQCLLPPIQRKRRSVPDLAIPFDTHCYDFCIAANEPMSEWNPSSPSMATRLVFTQS